ncbi:Pycsar system effector family protein [Streptomyces sp. NBC_01235]|uniref:Pycsar system effector family protein n=1 Tax=Streptomyces sp. NBC_01235 TaxID=2903788 RepID=UPI002E0E4C73|nr:DUF5706 domain-containing protein [Streptomyces sp. NBC_01235]
MSAPAGPDAHQPPANEISEPLAVTTAWRVHASITDWTGRADAKASTALSVELAVLAGAIALITAGHGLGGAGTAVSTVLMGAGTVLVLLGVFLATAALLPRTWQISGEAAPAQNFVYFGSLRAMPPAQVVSGLREANVLEMLSGQLVAMSRIVWWKLMLVKYSLMAAGSGLLLISIAVYVSA